MSDGDVAYKPGGAKDPRVIRERERQEAAYRISAKRAKRIVKLDPAKCIEPGCQIDPQKMERRKVLLRDEGPARVWLVVNGPHALAYQLEVKALNELSAKGEGHA